MVEAPGQGGLPDPRCACYEYDVAQVCDLVLRPGHSGSLEPFEPGSPDRESGILSAKIVDRAILPEHWLPENEFQLRIVVFSILIGAFTLGTRGYHQPSYRRDRRNRMNSKNTD